jgi:hypothetical protein
MIIQYINTDEASLQCKGIQPSARSDEKYHKLYKEYCEICGHPQGNQSYLWMIIPNLDFQEGLAPSEVLTLYM